MALTNPTLNNARILLASNSPRRRELMALIVPDYIVAQSRDVDESYPPTLEPQQIPAYLSRLKAEAYRELLVDNEIIITADTVVINDGMVLGKPHSPEQAVEMLTSLMGKTHLVTTGVTLTSLHHSDTFAETTEVTFCRISDAEIRWYVENFMPMDKAGAYGIQEWIGCTAITGIKGCFYNVMGLPLHSLYSHLKAFNL